MGWFRERTSNVTPVYTGLDLQTATNTLPIPILWGINKISLNLLWYANFQTVGGPSGGKGKGFFGSKGGNKSVYYTADIIAGLCEGPIDTIGQIWKDQSIYSLGELGLSLFPGYTPQAVWPYLAANYPTQALAYQGTAYVAAASYNLGPAAVLSNHNFEIYGLRVGSGFNGVDADPSLCIYDFLLAQQYGVGFDAGAIDYATLFGTSGDASLQSYCFSTGIALSPALVDQEQASSVLTRWLQLCNCDAVWSAGLLKFIPYGDTTLTVGESITKTVQYAIPDTPQNTDGSYPDPVINVGAGTTFISDGGVVLAFSGAPFTLVGSSPGPGEYSESGGVYTFNHANTTNVVAITYTYERAYGFTPDLTPVYSLDDDDYIDAHDSTDPIQVSRLDPFDLPNIQRLEISDRNVQYALTPIEARDQSQIALYGPRVGSTITAHEICDPITVAPVVANAILSRGLYVRSNYHFKLGWEYCLLDPMDVVTITDATLGLNAFPVRIVSIEEDDQGVLQVVAEELVYGVSTPVGYQNQPGGGNSGNINRNVVPGNINDPPLIYEVPATIVGNNNPTMWFGASGGDDVVSNPNWGGANVWVSLDGTTFTELATIFGTTYQGVLTANLPAAFGFDTVNTLSVDLTESSGVLTSVTAEAAQQGVSLCLVGDELLAFETATLTSAYHYDLTGLARGLYGTTGASHSIGDNFWRIDTNAIEVALPANYIGVTLYFKFQSFNLFDQNTQSLADDTIYTYTPGGAGALHPIMAELQTGMNLDLGLVPDTISVADNFGTAGAPVTGSWDLGSLS